MLLTTRPRSFVIPSHIVGLVLKDCFICNELQELLRIIDNLHEQLKEHRKEKIHTESRIRSEVCKELGEQFVEIERACR